MAPDGFGIDLNGPVIRANLLDRSEIVASWIAQIRRFMTTTANFEDIVTGQEGDSVG